MEHEEIISKLPAYADGDVPEPERGAIARHLADCETCRQELEQWVNSVKVFFTPRQDSTESIEVLVQAVMARLPAPEQPARRSGLVMPDLRWLIPIMGFSLAAFMLSFFPYLRENAAAVEPVLGNSDAKVLSIWLEAKDGEVLFELYK